jgi:hypothetical protein
MSISHAFVLPDANFNVWADAVRAYRQTFADVAIVRDVDGHHLSRFRNVTTVTVPNVWMKDDPVYHLQRAFPMVGRVDVIRAVTPAALITELNQRIADKDRYGEKRNTPQHLYDRFLLDWPTTTRPAKILRTFSAEQATRHEGIDITASAGGDVFAGAGGVISKVVTANDSLNYGAYVQVTSVVNNQAYVVTYAGLRDIRASVGNPIQTGAAIGKAVNAHIKIVVQRLSEGLSGFKLPNVIDPADVVYLNGIRVRSTVANLRIRHAAGLFGVTLGFVTPADLLEVTGTHGEVLSRVGVAGKWIRIRYAGFPAAYSGAAYLEAVSVDDPPQAIENTAIVGMNLDANHTMGKPDAAVLSKLGWVRLLYHVSLNPAFPEGDSRRYGNTDITATFNRYRPILERYANVGLKVILVLTHQTFGEGQGYVWPQMDAGKWRSHRQKYVEMVGRIAAQFSAQNLVYAYQIWNEQDTPPQHARAAVPMPAQEYAQLLAESIQAIRQHHPSAKVITGGHIGGPSNGIAYMNQVLTRMPSNIRPDGVAFHPYGRGPAGSIFSPFGAIVEEVEKWVSVLPSKPVWITEWGVLDKQGQDSAVNDVTRYARGFLNDLNHRFPAQIAAAIWYAWADGMDNGYGLVRQNGTPRQPLYDLLLK